MRTVSRKFIGKVCGLAAAVLWLFLLLPLSRVSAKSDNVIRVGFPDQQGLTQVTESGAYTGFTYEYLQEIAQYTGWQYEFVRLPESDLDTQLEAMMKMLQNGELDVMGGMRSTAADYFELTASSCGTSYTVLAVDEKNTAISGANYQNMENMRVAVLESAPSINRELDDFCAQTGINVQKVVCQEDEERYTLLAEKRVDAILLVEMSLPTVETPLRTVARFAPKPIYFGATKGNFRVVNALNSAINLINATDPYFAVSLYEKYFLTGVDTLFFTDEEKEYLESAGTLTVAVTGDRLPLEHYAKNEMHGIGGDVLKLIAEKSGLKLEFVPFDTVEDIYRALSDKRVDLAACVEYDYNMSAKYNFSLTRPYASAQVVMAVRKGVNPYELKGKRLALTRGLTYDGGFMGEVTWYDSIFECLEAVDSGEQDYCYGNGYSVQYYSNRERYRNLTLVPLSAYTESFCIAVAQPADAALLTVLNKAVRSVEAGELQAIIYGNTTPPLVGSSLKEWIYENPIQTVAVILSIMLVVAALLLLALYLQRRGKRQAVLENRRYRLLAELTGEQIFEYDYNRDELLLTQDIANAFGCERTKKAFLAESGKTGEYPWVSGMLARLESTGRDTEERKIDYPDGTEHWLRVSSLLIRDVKERPAYAIGKVTDIQGEKEEREELARKASSDGLTGLYNSAASRRLIAEALADPKGGKGALFMLDIDWFKKVNDEHGHYAGDQVLQKVAAILKTVFCDQDVLGRVGGDEFIVYMTGCSSADTARERCRIIRHRMEETFEEFPVTASIGCVLTGGGEDYDSLYRTADKVLYAVKNRDNRGFEVTDGTAPEKPGEES